MSITSNRKNSRNKKQETRNKKQQSRMNISMSSIDSHELPQKHRLSQAAWFVVKEFLGVYNIKMDYSRIKKSLTKKQIANAYFIVAKQPLIRFSIRFDWLGNMVKVGKFTNEEWISIILKRAAKGYKNREFYEELQEILHPPKFKCICGKSISSVNNTHRNTKAHINHLLKNVCLDKIGENDRAMFYPWFSPPKHVTHNPYRRKYVNLVKYMRKTEEDKAMFDYDDLVAFAYHSC